MSGCRETDIEFDMQIYSRTKNKLTEDNKSSAMHDVSTTLLVVSMLGIRNSLFFSSNNLK